MNTFKIVFLLLAFSSAADGSLEIGVGLSSSMSGRHIPGMTAAYLGNDWALSGTSTGAHTATYYTSAYTASYYRTWNPGKFFWGNLRAGFGGGLGYIERGYRSSTSTSNYETRTEILAGPSFRATWNFLGPMVFTFDGLYGFGIATIGLPPLMHDLVMFSLGCEI
ncbi:MAG: hypothetical protein SGI74_03405 [Oligoflexia bacterium]|nr:hypothetical protein [Oligoflexia bacterium]